MDLNTIWFMLIGVLFTGYAILDGFDLGTGLLLLCTKEDRERRIFLNAIGPIWNGNEVWLVTGGGALFAAFPEVYATIFSGFYDALMVLLAALIFRAVAIEFRSQQSSHQWRSLWDLAFVVSSGLVALILGVALGNVVWGVPLDDRHDYQGDLLTLFRPYPLLVGVTTLAMMAMHANLYLILKTDGSLRQKLLRWSRRTVPAYLICFTALTVITATTAEHLRAHLHDRRVLLGVLCLVTLIATLNVSRELRTGYEGRAFLSSAFAIAAQMLLFAITIYPNLVISRPELANSLTIYNGSSTEKSLNFMYYVALIGVPFVVAYTASIYYVFRGKVVLTEGSY